MIRKILLVSILLSGAISYAQSAPAAEGGAYSLWVGAEASFFNPDWGCPTNALFSCSHELRGVAVFADLNHLFGRVGLEGEGRWLPWNGNAGVREANYLVGPRVQIYSGRRFSANGKVLAGAGIFQPRGLSQQWWSAFVPGLTLGYKVSHRLTVRADYEYQRWPGFVGNLGPHGLTPNGLSLGVSYRVFR